MHVTWKGSRTPKERRTSFNQHVSDEFNLLVFSRFVASKSHLINLIYIVRIGHLQLHPAQNLNPPPYTFRGKSNPPAQTHPSKLTIRSKNTTTHKNTNIWTIKWTKTQQHTNTPTHEPRNEQTHKNTNTWTMTGTNHNNIPKNQLVKSSPKNETTI